MAEVIVKPGRAAAIESRPESRLTYRPAARKRHPLIVVGDAGDHVNVGVDVIHVKTRGQRTENRGPMSTGRWWLPVWIVGQRKQFLNDLSAARMLVEKHFQAGHDSIKSRVIKFFRSLATMNTIENCREFQQFGAGFEEMRVEHFSGRLCGQCHDENLRRVSRFTSSLRLPERNPCKSSVTNRKPRAVKSRASVS